MPPKKRLILSSNRPLIPDIHFSNIYPSYKWKIFAISANISQKLLCPLDNPSPEKTETHNIMCDICYNYYPTINETNCCSHPICTECVAATVDPKTFICPFCRSNHLTLTPILTRDKLKLQDADDEAYQKYEKKIKDGFDFDEAQGCSDDAIAIALQYQVNVKDIDKLIKAGVSSEEIILSLTRPKQGNLNDDIKNYELDENSQDVPITNISIPIVHAPQPVFEIPQQSLGVQNELPKIDVPIMNIPIPTVPVLPPVSDIPKEFLIPHQNLQLPKQGQNNSPIGITNSEMLNQRTLNQIPIPSEKQNQQKIPKPKPQQKFLDSSDSDIQFVEVGNV